jgi:hypothetical protein
MSDEFFCNLAKAFAYVSHDSLLNKSHFYGVQRIAAKCFRFYLFDRKQKDKIKSPNNAHN